MISGKKLHILNSEYFIVGILIRRFLVVSWSGKLGIGEKCNLSQLMKALNERQSHLFWL